MSQKPQNTARPAREELPFAAYSLPAVWNGLILVGEAPGAEEARLGVPFVGRSGQLLDKILDQAAIKRSECLVANVFRLRPPDNKVDHFFISRRAAQTQNIAIAERFGKFGSALCRDEFSNEIEALSNLIKEKNPPVVVALGRTPLWALTGENGLLGKVGQVLDCRLCPGTPVIPTFHPSFILRGNWGLQDQWRGHFLKAVDFMKKKQVVT